MRVVIVGGVAAGMSAAAKANRMLKDAEVVVYEMGDTVSWGACGLPYFVGGFFESADNMIARPVEKFRETGVDVQILHEVTGVNPETKTLTVKNLETGEIFSDNYDKLMIASGASAIIPPIKNVRQENVFTLKSLEDGIRVKEAINKDEVKEIVVIGAGYIGIETVEAAHHLGKNVRLIQLDTRVLPDSFDKEITDVMEEELRSYDGVELHLEEMVTDLLGEGKVTGVKTNKGEYKADMVVISTGVRPNTSFLEGTGIEMIGNGAIIIDSMGKTNIEDIYSAGDCATVPHRLKDAPAYIPLATTANKIGRIVGENLAGAENVFPGTLGSACVKVMAMEAGRTGLSESEAANAGINFKTMTIKDKNQTSYYPGQEDIWVKLIYNADTKVILGGQMIGKNGAVLRVDTIATAIYTGMKTSELGMLDLCYAPPFARTWDVLNVVGNVAK